MSDITQTSFKLSWAPTTGARGYTVGVSEQRGSSLIAVQFFLNPTFLDSSVTAVTVSGLNVGTTYSVSLTVHGQMSKDSEPFTALQVTGKAIACISIHISE